MKKNKYESPFPGRPITGDDFNELVNYLNQTIESSDISQNKLNNIDKKIDEFNSRINNEVDLLQSKLIENEETINKIKSLDKRIDNFYSKIIEIVGKFIAIFSFIIAGIQISFKTEGSFIDILIKSGAIFLPLTICIGLLLIFVKMIAKR